MPYGGFCLLLVAPARRLPTRKDTASMSKTINQYPGLCVSCGHWKPDCYAKRCHTCRMAWADKQRALKRSSRKKRNQHRREEAIIAGKA